MLPPGVLARTEIEALLPHRDPFLLVDAVREWDEERCLCEWRVPERTFWTDAHYPGNPITPGVLLTEHVLQSAALWIALRSGGLTAGDTPVLTRLEDARFKRVVRPGERLLTEVTLRERVGPAWYLAGRVACEGASVLRLRFALATRGGLASTLGPEP